MGSSNCRLVTLSEVDRAAQVLAGAFVDDPLYSFILPNQRTREKTLIKFFRAYGKVCVRSQRAYGVSAPLRVVALWRFPGQDVPPIGLRDIPLFLPLLLSYFPIGAFRARQVIRQVNEMHRRHAGGPHYYLDNIGVLSSERGKGLASDLLRPMLAIADSQRASVYTDTTNRLNVPIYEHFGFECVEERQVAGTGITIWGMRRPTRAKPAID